MKYKGFPVYELESEDKNIRKFCTQSNFLKGNFLADYIIEGNKVLQWKYSTFIELDIKLNILN